ncbi:MAG TPA: hypothetical protein VIM16_09655 [Mucilaginibacter sp.]
MTSPFYPGYKTPFGTLLIGIIVLFIFSSHMVMAQGAVTYNCAELSLSGTTALKCDPVSEDDPNDLAECYS